MVILGIDPALTITGYGVIASEKQKMRLIEAGIIKTSPQENILERLYKIHHSLEKLISDTQPHIMVVEKLYSHHRHPATSYLLGQARGVICLACAQKKLVLIEYGATQVKKALTGRGLASKYQVQRMVGQILGLENFPRYSDVSDALALAIAHTYLGKKQ